MAPSIAKSSHDKEKSGLVNEPPRQRLKYSGSLDCFERFDVTTVIGTEFFPGVQLAQLLVAPNSDDLLRDLALLGFPDPFNTDG